MTISAQSEASIVKIDIIKLSLESAAEQCQVSLDFMFCEVHRDRTMTLTSAGKSGGSKMVQQLALVVVFFSLSSHAIMIEVLGKDGSSLFKQDVEVSLPSTVGDISVAAFENNDVPYDGSIYGISEIFGIEQSLDILSRSEMKAYGWCFSVDDVVPETLTHLTEVSHQNSTIRWFYAYAHYLEGEWVGQCVESFHR